MTNPNGKAMSPKEAAEQLRKAIKNSHHADTHVFGWGEDNGKMSGADDNLKRDLAALATLEALAEENEKVKAESSQWRVLYNLWEAECGKLKAEVEQNKALITDLTRDMNEEHDRAESAEAELKERDTAYKEK